MARPISDEELQLKKRARRRLVGAVVLVSAVAVILPMVLDSEPRPVTQNVDIQIPSPDGDSKSKSNSAAAPAAAPLKSTASLTDPSAQPKGAGVEAPSKGASAPAGVEAPSKGASAPAGVEAPLKGMPQSAAAPKDAPAKAAPPDETADSKSATEDKSAKASAKDSASASGAYVVQVAALADAARVRQLQKQMSAAGIKTYTEAVTTKTGEITRVRAGPYATREAAESARSQLKKAGLDGKVVPK